MLFSDAKVAEYINSNFEPVWESVRPVPTLRLDFGNGTVVTRTLNGNIATYVCTPKGEVLDVLPGIYTPTVYLQQLDQFRLLAGHVKSAPLIYSAFAAQSYYGLLCAYHQSRAAALKKNEASPQFIELNGLDVGKARIERATKTILVLPGGGPRTLRDAAAKGPAPKFHRKEDLRSWDALVKDTEINENVRRLQVHERLAKIGTVRPNDLTKWLYKEVLNADLDDPYLGLGKVLFESYVFEEGTK